ncbi:MAG: hypothetical protein AB1598_00615 [Thermodesulfobacteriota bacterium]
MLKKTSPTRSEYEHRCSDNEHPGVQNLNPKEYTVEGSTGKEDTVKKEARKKQKRAHEEARASSSFHALDDYGIVLRAVLGVTRLRRENA